MVACRPGLHLETASISNTETLLSPLFTTYWNCPLGSAAIQPGSRPTPKGLPVTLESSPTGVPRVRGSLRLHLTCMGRNRGHRHALDKKPVARTGFLSRQRQTLSA
jgi:hypothetical protein